MFDMKNLVFDLYREFLEEDELKEEFYTHSQVLAFLEPGEGFIGALLEFFGKRTKWDEDIDLVNRKNRF